jgi:hypothetical protein
VSYVWGFLVQSAASLVAGGLAAAAIVWLAKTTIAARLKEAIKSEYDVLLETHRHTLRIESDAKLQTLKSESETLLESHRHALQIESGAKLEVLKSQLKSNGDIELERLRSSLNIAAAERQVFVAGLYERRADALQSIYKLLADLHDKLVLYVDPWQMNGGPTKEKLRLDAAQSYDVFSKTYKQFLIFVPAETAEKLRALEHSTRAAYNKFAMMVQDRNNEWANQQWPVIAETVNTNIAGALAAIEENFRSMLVWRPVAEVEPEK